VRLLGARMAAARSRRARAEPAAAAAATSRRLRVLTLNAYAGPPAPWSHLAKPLQTGRRLRHQAAAIAALAPDIICLQEVLADSARVQYIEALQADYEPSFARDPSRPRLYLRQVALLSMYAVQLWLCWQPTWRIAALVLSLTLLACMMATITTLWAFLFGDTHPAGLLTFTKRSRLTRVGEPIASPFAEQEGDWMNVVRPRGVLWQRLECKGDRRLLVIGNTHADALSKDLPKREQMQSVLQPSAHRRRQLHELFSQGNTRAKKDGRARVILCGDLNTGEKHGRPAQLTTAPRPTDNSTPLRPVGQEESTMAG
jgi:hypothetical protein